MDFGRESGVLYAQGPKAHSVLLFKLITTRFRAASSLLDWTRARRVRLPRPTPTFYATRFF